MTQRNRQRWTGRQEERGAIQTETMTHRSRQVGRQRDREGAEGQFRKKKAEKRHEEAKTEKETTDR